MSISYEKRINIYVVSLVIYCLLCVQFDISSIWYEGVFCVPLGMYISLKKEEFDKVLAKKALPIIALCAPMVVISAIGSLFLPMGIILKIISTILFVIMVLSMAFLVKDTSIVCNKITHLLGDYSIGIYAGQGFVLALRYGARLYIKNPYVFVVSSLLMMIVVSCAVEKVYDTISKVTRRIFC